jgi:serine/threonine protein kinase
MATVNRCFNCFAVKLSEGICAHCGHSGEVAHHPSAIPPGTLLEGRFLIGKMLGQASSLGFIYLGWCLTRQERIIIQEYLPRGVASRNLRNGNVTTYAETRDAFTQGLATFAVTGKQLSKVNSTHIARIREQFAARDTGYRVLDQLTSDTLTLHLQRRGNTLPLVDAADIGLQVLDALETLNAVGVTQSDISPDTILFTRETALLAGISWSKTNTNEISLVSSDSDQTRISANVLQLLAQLVTGQTPNNPAIRNTLSQQQSRCQGAEMRLLDMAKTALSNPEQSPHTTALRTLLGDVKAGTDSTTATASITHVQSRNSRRLATPVGIAVALGCTVTVMVQMLSKNPDPTVQTTIAESNSSAINTKHAEITAESSSSVDSALSLVTVSEAHASIDPTKKVVDNIVAQQIERQAPAAGAEIPVVTTTPTVAAPAVTQPTDLAPAEVKPVVVAVATTEAPTPAVVQQASQALNEIAATPTPPAQPEPSPEEQKLTELLKKAQLAEKKNRLTEPTKDNAALWYREIIKLQNDHAEARAGIEKIVSRYLNDATDAMAKLDWEKAEQALKKAEGAHPKSADVERMRIVMKAAQMAQQKATQNAPATAEANTTTDTTQLADAAPKIDENAINALRQDALAAKMPIINVHYENGNQRRGAFVITNLGETTHPRALNKHSYTFVWPSSAKSAWVVFEQRKGKNFHFDWPVALNFQRDLANMKITMNGVDVIPVYINNQLEISSTPNFGKKKLKPKELLGAKGTSIKPFEGATIYLRGTMNDWDVTTPMEYNGNFAYLTEVDLSDAQNYEFKFADEGWSSNMNFGSDFRTKGKGLSVGPEAQNLNFYPTLGEGKYEYAFFSIPTHEGFYNFYRIERKSSGGAMTTASSQ